MALHDAQRPSKDLFGARIRFSDANGPAPHSLPYHYHDSYEMFRSLNPALAYRINGAIYDLDYGDILVLNQFDIHQSLAVSGTPYHRQIALFYPEFVSAMSAPGYDLLRCFEHREQRFSHRIRLRPADAREYQRLFRRGEEAAALDPPERDMVQRLVVAELLVIANHGTPVAPEVQGTVSASAEESRKLQEVIRYIDAHLVEHLTLSRLADVFATTPNGLNRLCRKAHHLTIHQYILRRRIQAARLELSSGTSVTEAAYASGFGNLSHFVRMFRQKTGVSPKEFQSTILRKSAAVRPHANA